MEKKTSIKPKTGKKSICSRVKKTGEKKTGARKPLVSIVMPVYNGSNYIDNTIHSVLGQTYKDWELIVVDDASTDNTLEVISEFSSDKIRVIKCRKNGGAAKARNRGIRAAKGRYICFLDADDLWQPRKLEWQIEFMREKDCVFSFGSYVFADAKGRPSGKVVRVPESITGRRILRKNLIVDSTVMLDTQKVKKSDLMVEQSGEKWSFLLEKAGRAYGIHEVMAICGYDSELSIFGKWWRRV